MATKSELLRAAQAEVDKASVEYIRAWTDALRSFILDGLSDEEPGEGESDGTGAE